MAQQKKSHHSEWKSFIFGLAVLGVIATVILIPVEYLHRTYSAQREAVQWLLGDAEEAIYENSFQEADEMMQDGASAIASTAGHDSPLAQWTRNRTEAIQVWTNLISYRLDMVLAWLLGMLPLIIAAFVDGYNVREARKYAFFSQSPIRHKAGIQAATFVFFLALVSIGAPLAISPLLVPASLLGIGFAGWLWISNLQKRL